MTMRIKICGITKIEQGKAIADFGADTLGFICFPPSPRYLEAAKIKSIVQELPKTVTSIGVFVNSDLTKIEETVKETGLTGVQLHGHETPNFCIQLRELLPKVEIIKALRIKNLESLNQLELYANSVDTLLLDAYHPQIQGGTGQTLPWEDLRSWKPPLPWFLAGGLTPQNITTALSQLKPNGIDLSSGVECAPGDKDLELVAHLFEQLIRII
jgi:phosphoribosylanthranilate isomerase